MCDIIHSRGVAPPYLVFKSHDGVFRKDVRATRELTRLLLRAMSSGSYSPHIAIQYKPR
jgi:hypothetical protein